MINDDPLAWKIETENFYEEEDGTKLKFSIHSNSNALKSNYSLYYLVFSCRPTLVYLKHRFEGSPWDEWEKTRIWKHLEWATNKLFSQKTSTYFDLKQMILTRSPSITSNWNTI